MPAGKRLSKEQIEDYRELRTLISPTKSFDRLDTFSTWLFSTVATVGTLGAGFQLSGQLHGAGRRVFAAAVICAGVSLAFAAMSKLPARLRVNRYSADSMRDALRGLLIARQALLVVATIFFAAALVLAGIAPIFSK